MKKGIVFLICLMASAVGAAELPKTAWVLRFVDSQETASENSPATNAFDGNPASIWHTGYSAAVPNVPHEIQIDLGESYSVNGFSYLPRQDGVNGRVAQYEFYVSADGVTWGTTVVAGVFANDAALKQVAFAAKQGRYVRFRAITEVNGGRWTTVAELGVSGEPVVVGPTIETTLIFEWDQPGEPGFLAENLGAWSLWQKDSETGAWRKILDIPYTGQALPSAEQVFTITGLPNTTVRAWFAVDALNKNGIRSDKSNEVFWDFVIPEIPLVETPINVRVRAVIKEK